MALRPGLVISAVSVLLAGCGGGTTESKNDDEASHAGHVMYMGQIDASPADISLEVSNGTVIGAVCQDARAAMKLDPAKLKGGKAQLAYATRDIGTVSIADDLAVGTIELSGTKHKFRADRTRGMPELCGRP
jgi:hypothetical protein